MMKKRLKVLLLTSKRILAPGTKQIGHNLYCFNHAELDDYIEILSANNIAFDIKYNDELTFHEIVNDDTINYSTIMLVLPGKLLSEGNINILKKVSYDFGISIVASYNRLDKRFAEIFGLREVKAKQYCLSCMIEFDKQKIIDFGIAHEIKLKGGLRLQLHRGGLRSNSARYLKSKIKELWEQFWRYVKVSIFKTTEVLAVVKKNGDPAIVKYQYGEGINYYIAFELHSLLGRVNALHRIIRVIVEKNSGWGMVKVDLEDVMILRMDDPGTCERVYLKGFDTKILSKEDWRNVVNVLKKYDAQMSVMYVPFWVDDGNVGNGRLFLAGEEVAKRTRGALYPSKDIVFLKNDGMNDSITYDYTDEFSALKEEAHSGVIDIEAHGLTHIDPDIHSWFSAKDRYLNSQWYCEFRHVNGGRDCMQTEQERIVKESAEKIENLFGVSPSTITPSGHQQSRDSEEIAHAHGYKIFSGECNSIKREDIIIRNGRIRSIFLEFTEPDSSFSASGYPVVGVFHDFDIAKRGAGWLEKILKDWKKKGMKRFITLRELAGYLSSSIEAYQDKDALFVGIDISNTGGVIDKPESRYFSKHRMVLDIRVPDGKTPRMVKVEGKCHDDYEFCKSGHRIKLKLPRFGLRAKQSITVLFGLSPSSH